MEKGHVVWWVWFTLFQSDGCIRVRREVDEVVAVLWSGCRFNWSGLGSATLSSQNMMSADYLNQLNEQVFPSMDFFRPLRHGHIRRRHCHDSSCSNCERVVQGAWDIIFTHGLAETPESPDLNLGDNLWDVLETAARLSHHQYNEPANSAISLIIYSCFVTFAYDLICLY